MTSLNNITLICIDCINQGSAISAIRKSLQQIKPLRTVFITDIDYETNDFEVIKIEPIRSVDQYSRFLIKELSNYFQTDYVMVIQADGYVIDGSVWDDAFLDYDYIGSPWLYPTRNVGNGAMSIRSKRLQDILSNDDFIEIVAPEDEIIGRLYRNYLEEKYQIKFATEEVAHKFSYELHEPYQKTFSFHSNFHRPFKEHIVIRRWNAMGDCIMVEPLFQYYHDKGYQVVFDCLPEIMNVFFNHPFKIKHISEMNHKIKPIKVINLDLSYESKPKQLVLKTYYEFAGIDDGLLRNSRLYVNMTHEQRLFKKYIVFHIDNTAMPHRNSYGVSWGFVAWHFTSRLGYTCIQVGKGSHEEVGTYFHTETKELLMYLLNAADAVVAIDSGVAQLSVALGRPTAIMTGSVNLALRYCDFEKIEIIHTDCPTSPDRFCYHEVESTIGKKCEFNENKPNCCVYTEWDVIRALTKLLKLN